MNDIKFRVFNFEREKFDYFNMGNILTYQDEFKKHITNGRIFEQHTGLKDKNGVEIYEGDIISYWQGTIKPDKNGTSEYEGVKYSHTENVKKEIIFKEQAFRIKNGNVLGSAYHQSDKIEVVGNIHQQH